MWSILFNDNLKIGLFSDTEYPRASPLWSPRRRTTFPPVNPPSPGQSLQTEYILVNKYYQYYSSQIYIHPVKVIHRYDHSYLVWWPSCQEGFRLGLKRPKQGTTFPPVNPPSPGQSLQTEDIRRIKYTNIINILQVKCIFIQQKSIHQALGNLPKLKIFKEDKYSCKQILSIFFDPNIYS